MKKTVCSRSDLVCLECGNVFSIMRAVYGLKKYGHINDLWCYHCKHVTKHFEVIDIGKFMFDAQYYNALQFNTKSKSNNNANELEMTARKLVLQRNKTDE